MATDDGRRSTDAELLEFASQDPGSFRVLYDRHSEVIYRFVLRRIGEREVALEVTAETFARAWFGREKFIDHRSGTALPWLYGIAANVIRESVRRQQLSNRATHRLGMALGIDRRIIPTPAWNEGLDEDLDDALRSLPPEQRRAVELRVLDDETYTTVAEELDCSEGAARIRVPRGLRALRKIFREDSK
ncbi:MAG: RNA polymerase sigma factor [Microthrixaceae bacterium]